MAPLRFHLMSTALLAAIHGLPAVAIAGALSCASGWTRWMLVFLAPPIYGVLLISIAGLLSRPFRGAIVAGRFKRSLSDPTYRRRRYYGLCWTSLYYFTPVYHLCLSVPCLKWFAFRLFGYRGQMEFTVYPDTWIRDLPLLKIGKGAYVANRATLGTNMPMSDGTILVEGIKIGERALIGHLVMLAAGTEVGRETDIEAGTAVGVRAKVGDRCKVEGVSVLNHASRLGNDVTVGVACHVGLAARVREGVQLPGFTSVPDRTIRGVSPSPSAERASRPVTGVRKS